MLAIPQLAVALVAALTLAPEADAAHSTFRMRAYALANTRLDPIASPGDVASHVHEIRGASRFRDVLDDPETMSGSRCTTVRSLADMSNYWTPAMYYINPNGTYSMIPSTALIYYTSERSDVQPFPPGLRMIAGDTNRRDIGALRAQGVKWYVDPFTDHAIPNYNQQFMANASTIRPGIVPKTFTANMKFPNCGWANQTLDTKDHFAHMAYPVRENGEPLPSGNMCPESHPIMYPQINVETFFELNDEQRANWRTDKPNMVLANGDVTGATFHGDFVNAWDTAKLARAIKECTGGVDDCPVLFKENENLDLADCRLEGQIVNEDVGLWTPINKLPGCNPLWEWDGPLIKPACEETTKPGIVSPNLALNIRHGYNVPYVIPGAKNTEDPSNLGGCENTLTCPVWTKWAPYSNLTTDYAFVSTGTQEEVDANVVRNDGNNRVIVPGLENKAPFTATAAASTVSLNIPTQSLVKSVLTQYCAHPEAQYGLPCPFPTGLDDKSGVAAAAAPSSTGKPQEAAKAVAQAGDDSPLGGVNFAADPISASDPIVSATSTTSGSASAPATAASSADGNVKATGAAASSGSCARHSKRGYKRRRNHF